MSLDFLKGSLQPYAAFGISKLLGLLASSAYKIIISIVVMITISVFVCAKACTGSTDVGGDYEIPHSGINITAPNTGGGFALLYTADTSIIGGPNRIQPSCTGSASVGYTITNVPAGTIYSYSGYTIYPTSIKGIGVSFNSATSANKETILQWPNITLLYSSLPDYTVDLWVTIRVWKTPEYTFQTNAINFTGPAFNEVVQANGSGTIPDCPSERLDEKTCVYVSRTLIGNTQFISGTCQLTNQAQVVHMGKIPSSEVGITPWVDASFSINCPTAYGYGGAVHNAYNENDTEDGSVSSNNTKNNTVKIQIIPYSEVVDSEHGIMSLNSGGAEGVGIQLAWGTTSEQSIPPQKPVTFGTAINISTLNSNFRNGPYEYGSNASSSQGNLINMAARYVKTTGKVVPGQVNAAIEVMASYE